MWFTLFSKRGAVKYNFISYVSEVKNHYGQINMDADNMRESKELLIRCWMTSNGMWLFYCHLFGFAGNMELDTTSLGPMGMRSIKGREDLENVLGEILSSLKTSSPRFHIADSAGDQRPEKTPDFEIEHQRIPLHQSAIPPTEQDQLFCTYISQLERFFKALPVGYSTTPSCAGCVIKKDESCHKEYWFTPIDSAKKEFSCPELGGIGLKGICCGIQID